MTLTQDKKGVKHALLAKLGYMGEAFQSPPEQRVSSCPNALKIPPDADYGLTTPREEVVSVVRKMK